MHRLINTHSFEMAEVSSNEISPRPAPEISTTAPSLAANEEQGPTEPNETSTTAANVEGPETSVPVEDLEDKYIITEVNEAYSCRKRCCTYTFNVLFYIMCSSIGLFVIDTEHHGNYNRRSAFVHFLRKITMMWSSIWMLIFIIVHICALAFDIYAIAMCPYTNCSYIYSSIATLRNNTNHSAQVGVPQPEKLKEYEDWEKVLVSTVIAASLFSYYIMVFWVLPTLPESRFSVLKLILKCISKSEGTEVLSPFVDSITIQGQYTLLNNQRQQINQGKPTLLRPAQARWFHLMFWFTVLLYVSNTVVYVVRLTCLISPKHVVKKDTDVLGLSMHLIAQVCVIPCCFIFSKVAYAISTKCLDLEQQFKSVKWKQPVQEETQCESERRAKKYLKQLKRIDKDYLEMFKATLKPYEIWFAWHWIFFIIVTFMSIAYLAETIVQERYGTGMKCTDVACILDLAHITIFVLQSCVLFLYPCFRAGTITASREILISKVSGSNWKKVPQSVKDSFVQYLKDQNCGFKISLLCARIPFGFNLAYLSIFIGVFGVILRLSL